jgi:dienelactone hydrolase
LGLSYRGYGKSTKSPTEDGLITDANTAYDWLRNKGLEASQIMVVGQSLGSGFAVQLASQKPVAAVALGAPYSSTVEIAKSFIGICPCAS